MWKKILDFPNYEVNVYGEVRRITTKRMIKCYTQKPRGGNRKQYMYVRLYNKGKCKQMYVHRLIAFYFIPNPRMCKCVDHIDRNGLNNRLDNLRWCTPSQNSYNAMMPTHNLYSGKKGVSKSGNKWRARIVLNQKEIRIGTFSTIEEAKEAYDKKAQEIAKEFFYEG